MFGNPDQKRGVREEVQTTKISDGKRFSQRFTSFNIDKRYLIGTLLITWSIIFEFLKTLWHPF